MSANYTKPPSVELEPILSQGDHVLMVLSDQKWHRLHELQTSSGTGSSIHSILTRLRNSGAVIDTRPTGEGKAHEYRLRYKFKPHKKIRTGKGVKCPANRLSRYKRNKFKEIMQAEGKSCLQLEKYLGPLGISSWVIRLLWMYTEYIPPIASQELLEDLLPVLKSNNWIEDLAN